MAKRRGRRRVAVRSVRKRDRRNGIDLFHALLVAVVVNLVVGVLLTLIHQRSVKPDEYIQIEMVTPLPKEESEVAESRSSQPAAAGPPRATAVDVVKIQQFSQFALPSMKLDTFGEDFSFGLFDDGVGMGTGGSGLGIGDVGYAFDRAGVTNGREILLFIDTSGSMKKHSLKVAQMVKKRFPQALVRHVRGCSILLGKGIVPMLEIDKSNRTKIFYVCDLHDQVSPAGLEKLELLLEVPVSRQLHIISYSLSGSAGLKRVVRNSGGYISVIRNSD